MITKVLSFDQLAPASTPAVTSATNTLPFLHPKKENLPAVVYNSTICKIEPAYETTLETDEAGNPCETQGKLKHIDVYHELTNSNGVTDIFRFRVYPEFNGITKWVKVMTDYGFTGDITEVVGLREVIKIGHGSKSEYAYIAARELVALPTPKVPNKIDTTAEDSETESMKTSATPSAPRGLAASIRRNKSSVKKSQMMNLLSDDDEDDEFADLDEYLEDND